MQRATAELELRIAILEILNSSDVRKLVLSKLSERKFDYVQQDNLGITFKNVYNQQLNKLVKQ